MVDRVVSPRDRVPLEVTGGSARNSLCKASWTRGFLGTTSLENPYSPYL
jgi:hypothetical protein